MDTMNDFDSDYEDTFITDADADWRWEDGEYIEEPYDNEAFYDDDAFASAGWGTDESYAYFEDNDPAHGDFY